MLLWPEALKILHVIVNEAERRGVVSATLNFGLAWWKRNRKDETFPNSPFNFLCCRIALSGPLFFLHLSPAPQSWGGFFSPLLFSFTPLASILWLFFSSVSFSLLFWVGERGRGYLRSWRLRGTSLKFSVEGVVCSSTLSKDTAVET